jgi:hypothetical protein
MTPSNPIVFVSVTDLIIYGKSVEGESWFGSVLEGSDEHLLGMLAPPVRITVGNLQQALKEWVTSLVSQGLAFPTEVSLALHDDIDPTSGDIHQARAAWLWGSWLGRATRHIPDAEDLRTLIRLSGENVVTSEAFFEETARWLQRGEAQLSSAMDALVIQFAEDPAGFVFGRSPAGLNEAFARWKELPPNEAFDLNGLAHVPYRCDFLPIIEKLSLIDPMQYSVWIDRIQNPVIVAESLGRATFDESVVLLKVAVDAHTQGFNQWKSMVAPMLLNAQTSRMADSLRSFSWPPADRPAFDELSEKLQRQMKEFADVLSLRDDGPQLVADWSLHLVRQMNLLVSLRALPYQIAMKAIIEVFGSSEEAANRVLEKLPRHRALSCNEKLEFQGSGKVKPEVKRMPKGDVLLVRLLLKSFRIESVPRTLELAEFEDLLLSRDPALSDASDRDLPILRHRIVACAMREEDLAIEWKRLWVGLEGQRLRYRHLASTQDYSANDTSLFLCSVGLGRFTNDREKGSYPVVSRALWDELYRAIWFQVLYYESAPNVELWRRLLILLLSALPDYLDETAVATQNKISEIFRAFAQDEELIVQAAAAMLEGGIADRVLSKALVASGTDLSSALSQYRPVLGNTFVYPLAKYWPKAHEILGKFVGSAADH